MKVFLVLMFLVFIIEGCSKPQEKDKLEVFDNDTLGIIFDTTHTDTVINIF